MIELGVPAQPDVFITFIVGPVAVAYGIFLFLAAAVYDAVAAVNYGVEAVAGIQAVAVYDVLVPVSD